MTTHSRERREAVIDALVLQHHVSEDGDISFAAMADAALAAALPDRTVFTVLLDNIMVWSRAVGADATDEVAAMLRDAGVERLFALVYGDDARAGEE